MNRPAKIALSLLLLLLSGCAAKEPEYPRVLWPALPERPRFEWLGNFYSEDSFPKSARQRAAEQLLGKPPLNRLKRPTGIAADGKGLVFVSDADERNVKVIDYNKREVRFLLKQPVFGMPAGLAVDSAGRLYVADPPQQRIWVFDSSQQPLFSFGDGQVFEHPAYLAINEQLGRIYVSDGRGHQVVVFNLEGGHLFTFNNTDAPLYGPQGLAIDGQGRVFVVEQFNSRVQVFDADGAPLYMFGERGGRDHQFESPKDLAFDSEGNLHMVDNRRGRFSSFAPDGTFLLSMGASDPGHPLTLLGANSIYIDQNDHIYIGEGMGGRFTTFKYFSDAYLLANPLDEQTIRKQEELVRRAQQQGQ